MEGHKYAPGGRISADTLSQIEKTQRANDAFGLSTRQVERIRDGQHWRDGWVPRRLPDESKVCVVCAATFWRRKANGRLHVPKLWSKMVACSYSCNVKAMWQRGVFRNRKKKR